jgi:hypothetical protein
VIAVSVSGLSMTAQLALGVLVLAIVWRAYQSQARWTGSRVRLQRDGSVDWRTPGDPEEHRGRLVGHWQAGPLVALVLQPDREASAYVRIALWRDQTDADSWRRLVILLRHDRRGGGAVG